ncbi:anti-sigma U factor RsuA [Sphaerisporangium flaviroseum]|uniref:Anti-sigma U factor RsuA n=1 Tax=Sphaerisporangium flaviroseum TaxID=509199 RepID=A0ABP7JEP7_9ACTN
MSACEDVRMALGAHILGALDADEAVLIEAHLATCPECRAEFDQLRMITVLLAKVSEEDIEQAASPPHAVLDRMIAASAKRHRVHRLLLGLAASLVAVVLAGTAWLAVDTSQEAATTAAGAPEARSAPADAAQRDQANSGRSLTSPSESPLLKQDEPAPPDRTVPVALTGEGGGVRAKLKLFPGDEGTTVQVSISGVPDGTSCRVTAIGMDGTRSPAGSWTIDDADYHGGPATFTGHTELTMERIRGFDIRTATGKRLVSIPYTR